jgi:hypothetical protein
MKGRGFQEIEPIEQPAKREPLFVLVSPNARPALLTVHGPTTQR